MFRRMIAVVSLLVLAVGAAQAQGIPRKGTFTGKFGWFAVGKVIELEKGQVFFAGEFSGVFFNDTSGGTLDGVGVSCPGVNHVIFGANGARSSANGTCVITDTDGDRIFSKWAIVDETFPVNTAPSAWEFLGGTGKYAGIKGKNKFQCWNNPAAGTGYCKWWVNYELP
jgi:hypothetical protein